MTNTSSGSDGTSNGYKGPSSMPISTTAYTSPPSQLPLPPTTHTDTSMGETAATSNSTPNNVGGPTGGQGGGNIPSSTSPPVISTTGGGNKPTLLNTVNPHSTSDPTSPSNPTTGSDLQGFPFSSSSAGPTGPQTTAPSTNPFTMPTTHGSQPTSTSAPPTSTLPSSLSSDPQTSSVPPTSPLPASSTISSSQSQDTPGGPLRGSTSPPPSTPPHSSPANSSQTSGAGPSPSISNSSTSTPPAHTGVPSSTSSPSQTTPNHSSAGGSIPSRSLLPTVPSVPIPIDTTTTTKTPSGTNSSILPPPTPPANSSLPGGNPSGSFSRPSGSSAPAQTRTPIPGTTLPSTNSSSPFSVPTSHSPTSENPGGPPTSHPIGTASASPPRSSPGLTPTKYSNPGSTPTPTSVLRASQTSISQIPSGVASPPAVLTSNAATGSSSDYISPTRSLSVNNVAVEPSTTFAGGSLTTVTLGTTRTIVTTRITSSIGTSPFTTTMVISTLVPVVSITPITSNTNENHNNDALIGGIVGGVMALVILLGLYFLLRARRRASQHQQLRDADIAAPMSPGTAEAMRESHPFRPSYSPVSSRQTSRPIHQTAPSFGSSAELQYPVALATGPGSPYFHAHSLSGSALIEHDFDSNNGYTSGEDGAETDYRADTEPEGPFISPKETMTDSAYAARNTTNPRAPSGLNIGMQIGVAIGSQSSLPNSLHTAQTGPDLLTPTTQGDDDEDNIASTPSPSAFPVPPWTSFVDGTRVLASPVLNSSSQTFDVSSTERPPRRLRTFLTQEASWASALAAASPVVAASATAYALSFAFSPPATKGTSGQEDASPTDVKTPTQANPPYEGGNGSSTDSHDALKYPDPFADRGDLLVANPPTTNRLSSASSGVEVPDNLSQCGIAL